MTEKTKPKSKPYSYRDVPLPQFYNGDYLPNLKQVSANPTYQADWFSDSNPKSTGANWGSVGKIGGYVSTGLSVVNNLINTDWTSGEGIGDTLYDTVTAGVNLIPVVGQAISAGLLVGDYVSDTVSNASASRGEDLTSNFVSNMMVPLKPFLSSIGHWISGEGFTPPQHDVQEKWDIKDEQKKKERDFYRGQGIQNKLIENPGLVGTQVAAYGGNISPKARNAYGLGDSVSNTPQYKFGGRVRKYSTGGTHEQSAEGGIPVDENANPASVSGQQPVARVEEGEVAVGNFIFSNRLTSKGKRNG
jgi:hypothetical protein